MKMLRDFEYHQSPEVIGETLARFNIELPEDIILVRFEVITPDSFMWRLLIGDGVYYLYAEDYVQGLGYVKAMFNRYLESDKWDFIKPKAVIKFESATPVRGATIYEKADDADDMMHYAVDSGHDFVFLARSAEGPSDAQCSESAPRGFTIGGAPAR